MSSAVPVELAEYIVDFLYDDIDTLAACALTSHALYPTARFHIWSEIVVPVQSSQSSPHIRIQHLLEILDTNPEIPPIVHSLTLRGVLDSRPRARIRERWDDPTGTMRLWERFPNLRSLTFSRLRFNAGLHQLLPLAYSLPNLEQLVVIASTAIFPWAEPTRPSYRDSIVQLHAPAKLKRLSVVGGAVSWSFLEDLAKVLLEPSMHAPLEALDLSCIVNSSNFRFATRDRTDTLPTQAWAPVITSVRSTLRQCTLGLLPAESDPKSIANLYNSLKQCAQLQSLSIIHPIHLFNKRSFLFLDMLADLLSSPNPHALFPLLEELSVEWRQPNGPLYGFEAPCKKLASALADRTRCPLLKRLKVSSCCGTAGENMAPVEEMEAHETLLRSCFGTVALVGLDLEISAT